MNVEKGNLLARVDMNEQNLACEKIVRSWKIYSYNRIGKKELWTVL